MQPKKTLKLKINPEDGTVTAIYSDAVVPFLTKVAGSTKKVFEGVKRASHVEPHPDGGWSADLSPVNGPVLMDEGGKPFANRQDALDAEVRWLDANLIGAKH